MSAGPYIELHAHTAFSFLDGASHPIEMAGAAANYGYPAMAVTDHDGVYGSMEYAVAAKTVGVRPITGAEITLDTGAHLTLLCETRAGYQNLCRIITAAHRDTRLKPADPDPPKVAYDVIDRYADGIVCLSGCATDGPVAAAIERGDHVAAADWAKRLLGTFGRDHLRIELQRPFARHDRRRNRLLAQLAERLEVPCVATGNIHAHARERTALQDAFVAVKNRSTLDETEPLRRGNGAHVLAPPEAMAERFGEFPDAVAETVRLAERLTFDITSDLGYAYPGAEDPDADRTLAELCWSRIDERYAGRTSAGRAHARLEEELKVIRSLGLSGFFILHKDLLELAREVAVEVRGPGSLRSLLPPGRGRGSSVASIVCFLTGLSHIDPVEKELFLGRFLNEDLSALPDIDLDFPRDIREVLIPRVHERYGHEKSALVAAFSTYHVRGAVRDFGKALGLAPGEVERVARTADPWQDTEVERDTTNAVGGRRAKSPRWRALMKLVQQAIGLPRHASQHPGGMVIATQPLHAICPIQPCAMEGRQMVQWEKESCADAGFLKIDLLGLGMLSAVERCVEEIARVRDEHIDLSRIAYDDQQVYDEIQQAETMGVFQIESRAQMQMLRRTRPESLDDLTVQVALVRPGPIQGGAVHPYIERRKALRADPSYRVPYEHPSLEPVLKDTLGAIVFQDQVIEVAMAFAGFTPGEAEGLRRAMSKRRSEEAMRSFAQKFVDGAVTQGAARDVAERVYQQIVGFSGFGFPKAHSAAFGLLAYQSTWLRVHYGSEFLCALLNEQPMGFYPPDSLVHEAQRRGLEIRPPDVGVSLAECHVEDDLAIRLGLGYVAGVAAADIHAIVADREEQGPFRNAADLASRCAPRQGALELLAWAGACDSLCEGGRREALWQLGVAAPGVAVRGGTQLALPVDPHEGPELRQLTPWERMLADYGSTKVTLREHPMELMRPMLPERYATSRALAATRDGARVEVSGLVVARQRPATAKGVTFMLLEDEFGAINLIVPPPVYESCRGVVRAEPLVWARGKLEHREGVTNVVCTEVGRLDRPDMPLGEVRHIEPKVRWSNDRAAGEKSLEDMSTDDLRAVVPAGHAFGRRG